MSIQISLALPTRTPVFLQSKHFHAGPNKIKVFCLLFYFIFSEFPHHLINNQMDSSSRSTHVT